MSDVAMEEAVVPQDRGIEVATLKLIFDEKAVRAGVGTPLEIVEEDADGFAKGLAVALSSALGVQVLIADIEVTDGSVTLKAKIIAFIIPIIQGAAGGALEDYLTGSKSEPDPYTQVCETVRTTTSTYSTQYFTTKGYPPRMTEVTTTTFKEVCHQVQKPNKAH